MPQRRDPRIPEAGTILRREFNGVTHEVEVLRYGFRYNGQIFQSLSAVARRIAGKNRNGMTFFNIYRRDRSGAGLGRPATVGDVLDTGKCKHVGCYNDATCKGGYCVKHFDNPARKQSYSGCRNPRTAEGHLGLEIECFATDHESHRGLLGQAVVPHADGSLPEYGCEFKLIGTPVKLMKSAANLVRQIAAAGGQVSRACGLHVHIDARQVTRERSREFVAWLASWEGFWFSIMPPSRNGNRYCHPLTGGACDRYGWATFTRHNTIEIRIHPGSLCPHKIAGWLNVMTGLMNLLHSNAVLPTMTATPSSAQLAAIFNPVAMEYLHSRMANNGVLTSSNVNGSVRREEVG